MVSVSIEIIYLKIYTRKTRRLTHLASTKIAKVGHMIFVPDIFALERTNGIEEISRYSDFDRCRLGNEKRLPNLHDTAQPTVYLPKRRLT